MRNACIVLFAVGIAGVTSNVSQAQVTVQQPSVGVFSGGTTVSVPDGGRTAIGGVGRAGSSRSQYGFGPGRSRSNLGVFNEAAGMSVGVRIHDLSELDRQVLAAAESRSRSGADTYELPPRAERAYTILSKRVPTRTKGSLAPVMIR
jgi:hypothetical protein